jgi:hypothetical protein
MDRDVHSYLQFHWLVITNGRPFHQIISLSMGIEPRFGKEPFFNQEFIIGTPRGQSSEVLEQGGGHYPDLILFLS